VFSFHRPKKAGVSHRMMSCHFYVCNSFTGDTQESLQGNEETPEKRRADVPVLAATEADAQSAPTSGVGLTD
jgi:hypothetical protein